MGLMALLLLISRLMYGTQSFVCQRQSFPSKFRHIPILLQAKKSRTSTASKGFSKIEKREYSETPDETKPTRATSSEQQQEAARSPSFLQSLESGGSSAIPNFDENLPPEERTKMILREKYGMKTLEEQQLTIKQQEALKERKKKMEEWKKKNRERGVRCDGNAASSCYSWHRSFFESWISCKWLYVYFGRSRYYAGGMESDLR